MSEGLNIARETPRSAGAFRSLGITPKGSKYVPLDEMERLERDYNIVRIGFDAATEELKQLARKCKGVAK